MSQPLLRIVRGDATPEEIAALVAVLTARAESAADTRAPSRSAWADPVLRQPLPHGPSGWRRSALPR
jgi:Acyl-CoA carboxylase epsilon subunit